MHEQHIRIKDALRRRTEEILRERDAPKVIELSPNMAVALIGGAQEEGREELMELWARLLANAMDPQFEHRPTFIYRGRKEMDPPDAVVLRHIHERNITSVRRGHTPEESPSTRVENIAVAIGRRSDEVEVSLRHLQDLLFFDYVNNSWYVNATSREFLRACYPEVKTA